MSTLLQLSKRRARLMATALVAVLASAQMAAANSDPVIEGARQCTQYFPVEEKKNNIPTHLLAAIATTESGRYHKGLGMSVPWPWTINVEGKGYHFDSKAEAIAQVQNLLSRGYRSIDVGCMQVNLKHHPKAFANLETAFDPETNVAYAAKFLSDNYATSHDWIKATAAYHSKTEMYGQRYLVDIERSWNRIVGKVNEARASKASQPQGEQANVTVATAAPVERVKETGPRVIDTTRPMQASRHVRVVKVNDTPRSRSSDVMVVRPAPAPSQEQLAVASAYPSAAAATGPLVLPAEAPVQGNSIRRVSLDNPGSSTVPTGRAPGPQFVFAN